MSVAVRFFCIILSVIFRGVILAILFVSFSVMESQAQIIDVQEGDEENQDRSGSSILDDSTKQIYGPKTTQYTFEHNIKYNNPHYFAKDTSIIDLHKYQFDVKKERLYTNLGNIGTPANSIYPLVPGTVGLTSGFNLFDLYFRGPDEIKYYNTRSPYSRFKIIWGGQGRSITEVNYARNIDPRSGFGFDFRGLFIDKQVQRTGRGDRNVRGTYYTLFGHYATKDGKYQVLGNFIRNYHKVNEYGGVLIEEGDPISVYFEDNRQMSLTNAKNNELRTNYHLYHQYKLNDQIQVYHEYDRYKQQNDFIDKLDDNSDYFNFVEVDSSDVKDRSKIVFRKHELGLKGDIGKSFYNFYYKYRSVDYFYKYLSTDTVPSVESSVGESYGGFNLRFGNDSVSYIQAFGEYLQGGNFKLGGSIQNSWFYAKGVTTQFAPSYVFQAYRGSHNVWVNNFDPTVSTKLDVGVNLNLGPMRVMPSVTNTLMSNYIYFRGIASAGENEQTVEPAQASADINILTPTLGIEVNFLRHFTLHSSVMASNVSGGSAGAVNLPDIFARGQLVYSNIHFQGNLEWRVGIDAYWKSSYYANGYDPAIMQFYLQNEFLVEAFPLIDVFVDAKINRAKLFLKLNNVYEMFSSIGYFATPEYPGQSTIFDFGFEWAFYD